MFLGINDGVLPSLNYLNCLNFESAEDQLGICIDSFKKSKKLVDCIDENYLNDLYVLDSYLSFWRSYCETWKLIVNKEFKESWCKLQDSIDLLKTLKKFSRIRLDFFENQLLELEKAYGYHIFMSAGIIVEEYECSICGKDIDSLECNHRIGRLYRGEIASGIAKNITIDHASLVSSPDNKRCVVSNENDSHIFTIIRYLSNVIENKQCSISDFNRIEISENKHKNPDYVPQGRNEQCSCGSGKKFKKCCIDKEYIDGIHADILAEPFALDDEKQG